jgi:Peptidase S80 family
MSSSVRFALTPLVGSNKAGVINKDANGRYEMVVGALNVFNSQGQRYVAEGAVELFQDSSSFIRRVKRGVLKAELGHPKPQVGQSNESFAQRVMSIYEENVCAIHHEIYLDYDRVRDENGQPVIAIMSAMSPSGPHGAALERSFQTPGENVCFSIRAFTDDWYEAGITKRQLKTIVTFDQVTEPGIAVAEKLKSPALEEYYDFSRGEMERGMRNIIQSNVATESLLLTGQELFDAMRWVAPKDGNRPSWMGW